MRDTHREKYCSKIKIRRIVLISNGILAFSVFSAFLFSVPIVNSHAHSNSKNRYQNYSRSVFDAASREKKPVLMVMSAVWCSWCAKYNRSALSDSNVIVDLNKIFFSVFVDIDRRVDLIRKYVRRIPTTVAFSPKGNVVRSFSGVLKSKNFYGSLKRFSKRPWKTPRC